MSDLNKVMLIGRLGADPEMKYTASGAAICNLRIATGKKWKDKQTGESKESTEWHRVVFFNRPAEVLGEYLTKGSQLYVEGELRTRSWETDAGDTRYATEIVGKEFQMLGGGKAQSGAPEGGGFRDKPKPATQPEDVPEDDIPF